MSDFDGAWVLEDFGLTLEREMRLREVTRTQLAERIGWSVERVEQALRGTLDITIAEMAALAFGLGCEISFTPRRASGVTE